MDCLFPAAYIGEYLGWFIICCTEQNLANFEIWLAFIGVILRILAGIGAHGIVSSSEGWTWLFSNLDKHNWLWLHVSSSEGWTWLFSNLEKHNWLWLFYIFCNTFSVLHDLVPHVLQCELIWMHTIFGALAVFGSVPVSASASGAFFESYHQLEAVELPQAT